MLSARCWPKVGEGGDRRGKGGERGEVRGGGGRRLMILAAAALAFV